MEYDDLIKSEDGDWVYLCEKHKPNFEGVVSSCPLEGAICSVKGCNESAEYYGDLKKGRP